MRQEFSTKVKVAAFERAAGSCQRCSAKLFPGNVEYHHDIPAYFDGPNTLENCVCLCRTCHRALQTPKDQKVIAKSRRVRAKHVGAKRKSGFRGWRRFNGDLVWKGNTP